MEVLDKRRLEEEGKGESSKSFKGARGDGAQSGV